MTRYSGCILCTTAQQHNSTTAQQHNSTTAQQHNSTTAQQHNNKLEFRADINGLRAWACLAVVFFHFQILNFQGGFVGVDVFFVISGYLMTAIIYPKLIHQQLNIIQFYNQRLKRVLPALFVMLFILITVGLFTLYSKDFYRLVHEAKVSLGFYYNIRFKDTDYFQEATTDFLLHTWTLGLEFQFYLLFSILLLLMYKFTKKIKHHIIILSTIAILSFIAMQYTVYLKPFQAFFLLQYRIWEFLAGAILFLIQFSTIKPLENKNIKQAILIIGWLSLISFFLFMSDAGHYPDYRTLIPVLATIAILYPMQNTFLTSNPVAQYLGKASYSIYLWHWSIYVFIGLYGYHSNTTSLYFFALLTIIIGCLSYIFVEQGLSKKLNKISNYKKQLAILLLVIIIPSIALNSMKKGGSVHIVEKNNQRVADIIAFSKDKFEHSLECLDQKRTDCTFGDTNSEVGLILIGDSHSASMLPVLDKLGKENNIAIATFMTSGCPIAFNLKATPNHKDEKSRKICLNTLKQIKESILNYPNVKIMIINRNNGYLLGSNEDNNNIHTGFYYDKPIDTSDKNSIASWQQKLSQDFLNSACEIAKTHQTYWFKPIPEMGIDVPKTLASNIFYRNDDSDIKITREQHEQRQYLIEPIQKQAEQQCGVHLVDTNPAFCDTQYCYGSSHRKVYYYDDDHLNITGSEKTRPYVEFLFKQ